MKVAIVGSEGFVGGAMATTFEESGVEVMRIDPKLEGSEENWNNLEDIDIIFVAVPTPYDPVSEGFDYSYIYDVATRLMRIGKTKKNMFTCLRSTVTPDFFTRPMSTVFDVYQPEFLTAANAVSDFKSPDVHIIGAKDPLLAREMEVFYNELHIVVRRRIFCTMVQASYLKMIHNVYRATRLSFLNELFVGVTRSHGSDEWKTLNEQIAMVFGARDFGGHYLDVPGPDGKPGYGGACFPKDVAAFIGFLKKNGMPCDILEAVQRVNSRMRLVT